MGSVIEEAREPVADDAKRVVEVRLQDCINGWREGLSKSSARNGEGLEARMSSGAASMREANRIDWRLRRWSSVVDALRRTEDVVEIELDSLGDDAEAWDGALAQILESEQCLCI